MEEQKNYIEEDEITLKELILKMQEFFREVIKNWLLITIITIPFLAYMFYKTYKTPVTYPAALTFMMNDNGGGGGSALGGLAASFGLGGGGGEYNLEKMLALLKSRNIIQRALFEKEKYNGKIDFYANHLIQEYDLQEEWKEDTNNTELKDFVFAHNNFGNFNRTENKVLKLLYSRVIGNSERGIEGILTSNISDDTGIMSIGINSMSEELSIKLVECIYNKLSKFYIDKTIEKQKQTLEITKNKVDSLNSVLNSSQYQLLKIKDTQRNLSLRQFQAEELRLQTQIQIVAMAYGEALKSQEVADFTLKNKTPFIQAIDYPIAPIKPSKTLMTYIKNLIIGGFLGGFLAVGYIIGRKILRDTMNE